MWNKIRNTNLSGKKNEIYLEIAKKTVKRFSSEAANLLKSYYKHYFKQAYKILASSDENLFTIFPLNKVKRKSVFRNIFCG